MNSCLMKAILNINLYSQLQNEQCSQLEAIAFNSHQSCYINNGFCNDILLNDTNLNYLVSEVFTFNDSWNEQAIQQVGNQ